MKGKNEFVEGAPDFYKTIEDAVANSDYKLWFTNRLAKEYVATLFEKYNSTKNAQARVSIHGEAEKVLQIYAMLVYYAYPSRPDFKGQINSDVELSRNFKAVKAWLDENGGKEFIDYSMRYVLANEAPSEGS